MNTKKNQHTPGPWKVIPFSDSSSKAFYIKSDEATAPFEVNKSVFFGAYHGRVGNHWMNSDRIKDSANACLIASSPELLATLERCADYFADRFDGYPESKESIAVKHLRESIKAVIAKAKGEI